MDVLKILSASGPDLPCIIVSGTIEEEGAVDAMKSGAGDFIAKDRMARLLPAVSRELQKAAERRQRRTVEVALSEAQDRMRFALEAAAVGTWESDISSGKTLWSRAAPKPACLGTAGCSAAQPAPVARRAAETCGFRSHYAACHPA